MQFKELGYMDKAYNTGIMFTLATTEDKEFVYMGETVAFDDGKPKFKKGKGISISREQFKDFAHNVNENLEFTMNLSTSLKLKSEHSTFKESTFQNIRLWSGSGDKEVPLAKGFTVPSEIIDDFVYLVQEVLEKLEEE